MRPRPLTPALPVVHNFTMFYFREVGILDWALVVATAIAIAAATPLILVLLRRHVARGGTSDVAAAEIASRTLAWQDAFRDASQREDQPWIPGLE